VQHAGVMRGGERGQQLLADPGDPERGQPPLDGQHLVEGARRDQLHNDPRPAVFLGHVVDGDKAAVRQPCGGPRLAQRALVGVPPLLLTEQGGDHDLLDRDIAVQNLVARTPNNAHGTAANGVLEVVTPGDDPPCHRGHRPDHTSD
jgi:hypothetical protein